METVWLQRLHVLFFMEVGSRCIHLAGCTVSPTGAWVVQLAWRLKDGKIRARFLIRDRDAKFTGSFDEVFRSEGVEVIRLPYRTPVAKYVLREFVKHYEQARPHQGLGQRIPRHTQPTRASEAGVALRHDRLGGVLHEYMRQAA